MAQIIFSEEAKALARKIIAKTGVVVPVVFVGWWKGFKDNYRGVNGEVCWRTIEEPRWTASIIDWKDYDPVKEGLCELSIDNLVVHLDNKARACGGNLMIAARNRELVVVHQD